jgi:hypothetical protein
MEKQIEAPVKQFVGMRRADRKRYSLGRVIRSIINQTSLDGLEGEMDTELRSHSAHHFEGRAVPNDIWVPHSRDLNVDTFAQGGAFVETSVDENVIELLRNQPCCERLGVQRISGLTGNCAIPRQTAAATAYSLPEQGALNLTTQGLDQVVVMPKRISCGTQYSKQLLFQSSPSLEKFLRLDLDAQINLKIDAGILFGQGAASEMNGVLNTAGIGSLNFGGTATWAEVVAFETALSQSNALKGRLGYITSPAVKGRWKNLLKTGVGTTSVIANSSNFIWNDSMIFPDGSNDGIVAGYRAAASNQVLNNLVFFGNWADAVLCEFGAGKDITVDMFTLASSATVRIIINCWMDLAIRHAASFCVSADSGAQ